MENRLVRHSQFGVRPVVLPGVVIPIEVRKIRTRNIQTQPLTRPEQATDRVQPDRVFANLAGLQQRWVLIPVPVLRTHDSVGQVHRQAIFIHDRELGSPVGVETIRSGPELQRNRPGDFKFRTEHRKIVDENVIPMVVRRLIDRRSL